jgi:spoIIIJ-associated protein
MADTRREIEARGQDVETAINIGLDQLGVGRGDVIVDILDEGSKGLLGIGSREAVVRLSTLAETSPPPAAGSQVSVDRPTPPAVARHVSVEGEAQVGSEDVEEGDAQGAALRVVRGLLEKMQVEASVTARLSEPDDLTGRRIIILDVAGSDLGSLIGPRGETLNALQHIARLMTSHQMKQRAHFVIDVEGYRHRREQALSRLAERMAQKVTSRQRAISLEPMPPNERRIIHVALREDDNVYTQSTGEGNRRRVRIHPKRDE